jgi:hypothetical protein
MNNFYFTFVLFAIACSCTSQSHNSASISRSNDEFHFDTLKDAKLQITYEIKVPILKSDSILTSVIQDSIQTHKQRFKDHVVELIAEDSTMLNSVGSFFSASPVSIYKDSINISVCYIFSTYFAGNVHGLEVFKSFNFDRNLKRLINFEDYFKVTTQQDSLSIKDLINKAINRSNIGISNIYKMDFCLIKDSISFNFSDYEIASYAEGYIQAHIPKNSLGKYINKIYR